MSTTTSKGKIFGLTVAVDDARLAAMKKAPELAAASVQSGAEYWHTGILPKHFEKSAHGIYGYADRSSKYFHDRRKGQKPDLVFSGSLRRDLAGRAAFKKGGSTVELKMTARVLNFVPRMPENSFDYYVKHKNGRGYPNLKREVKAILDDEREAVAVVVAKYFEKSLNPSNIQPEETIVDNEKLQALATDVQAAHGEVDAAAAILKTASDLATAANAQSDQDKELLRKKYAEIFPQVNAAKESAIVKHKAAQSKLAAAEAQLHEFIKKSRGQ